MVKYLMKDNGGFKVGDLARAVIYLEKLGYTPSDHDQLDVEGSVYVGPEGDSVSLDFSGIKVDGNTRPLVVAGLAAFLGVDYFKEGEMLRSVDELACSL